MRAILSGSALTPFHRRSMAKPHERHSTIFYNAGMVNLYFEKDLRDGENWLSHYRTEGDVVYSDCFASGSLGVPSTSRHVQTARPIEPLSIRTSQGLAALPSMERVFSK